MDKKFWSGKRVFITGHTGFKGSWLTLFLLELGAKVTGFSLPGNPQRSLLQELGQVGEVDSVEGDIRDLESLRDAVSAAQPDIVLHLAAQSLVRPSYSQPVETYAINLMGTVNLLESVRQIASVRAVIVVTSDKCYENREWIWGYREHDPMGGFDPYSSSKGCAELATAAYRSSFFTDRSETLIASVRAGNVIGGGDWAEDRLVPDTASAFARGEKLRLRYPSAVRPWQHVLEPLGGYLQLAKKLYEGCQDYAQAWNFGPGDDAIRPVAEVVDRMAEHWGETAGWEQEPVDQPHEAGLLMLDHSLARHLLGWQPRLTFDQTLDWVVEWFKVYYHEGDILSITQEQIKRYQMLDENI